MYIAIADDELKERKNVLFLLDGRHAATLYTDGESLIKDLDKKKFDLYILDIFMGELTGIEVAKQIREKYEDALICFLSTSEDFYREAFDVYAFSYLIKPSKKENFDKMLSRAEEHLHSSARHSITVTHKGKSEAIAFDRILFIESHSHTLDFYLKDKTVLSSTGQLDEIEKFLDPKMFIRCHQSFIINIYNATSLEKNEFVTGSKIVPISRKYADVKERFRQMLFEEME